MPLNLEPLLAHVPAWLMVLFRLAGIFLFAPIFASRSVLVRMKVFLAVGLSFCVYPMLLTPGKPSAALIQPVIDHGLSAWTLLGQIASEMLIGVVLGYGALLPLMGLQVGGRMVDQQMGLALAGVYNPEIDDEIGVVGQFYHVLALTVFLLIGGHRVLLTTLVGSFDHVPLGGFGVDGSLFTLLVGLLASMVELGVRVAAPLLCLVFLQTIAMGFIMRTVPQMNILSIGFPLRILAGATVIVTTVGLVMAAYIESTNEALRQMMEWMGR